MKAILLSLALVILLGGCASTGSPGNSLSPSATKVLQAASSFRPPSGGYLPVSRTDENRWMRSSLTWSIALPGAPATLSLSAFPSKGTIRFAGRRTASIRGIAKVLEATSEEPEVKAWLAPDGRLMIAVTMCYTAEVSEGTFSFRDGRQDQYLIQEVSTELDSSVWSVKTSRSFHSANGDVIAASTETGGALGSRDLLKDWEEVR